MSFICGLCALESTPISTRQGREELGLTGALEAANDLANFFRSVGKLQKALSLLATLAFVLCTVREVFEANLVPIIFREFH